MIELTHPVWRGVKDLGLVRRATEVGWFRGGSVGVKGSVVRC